MDHNNNYSEMPPSPHAQMGYNQQAPPMYPPQQAPPMYPPQQNHPVYPPQGEQNMYPPQGQAPGYNPQPPPMYPPQENQYYQPQGQVPPPPPPAQNGGYIPPQQMNTNHQQNPGYVYPKTANNIRGPTTVQCPQCNRVGITVVVHKPGSGTYLCAGLLFCFTFMVCCFIPFCNSDCQDQIHTCASCGAQVGQFNYQVCG